jgi:simple sugar transport system permease protein
MWDTILTSAFIVGLLQATLRTTTPLLLAALGELYSERSGVLNIGLEGIMLIGTLVGFLVSYFTGNAWLGVLAGSLAGSLIALIHAVLSVTMGVSQVVSGVGINILCVGLSMTIYRVVFGPSLIKAPMATGLQPVHLPVLSDLPVIGPVLFQQLPLVYIAFALAPITWFVLFRTELGLKIRAVGEHPLAAETVGVSVAGIRYFTVLLCGFLTGMAGTFLSLGLLNIFLDNMTAGRGWIALAVVILGRWSPFGILGAALFFGFADAIQLRLQALGFNVPYQFLLMIPYVLTMLALISAVGRRSAAPGALGKPFTGEAH